MKQYIELCFNSTINYLLGLMKTDTNIDDNNDDW